MNVPRRSFVGFTGWKKFVLVLPLLLALVIAPSLAQVQITLKDSFIEKYKNKATIEATYTIDKAHKTPNPASKDGDMHVAGRAPEILLPTVAEIMNAKFQKKAVDLVHQVEGTGKAVQLSGAWRLWCEHAGRSEQIQGADLEPFSTSNPDHVFEIHPVSSLDSVSVLSSFKPIVGFKTKVAQDAFSRYEGTDFHIVHSDAESTTTMTTKGVGYNYVEFTLEITGKPIDVGDGTIIMGSVLDLQQEMLVYSRRMIFVKGTPPEIKLRSLKTADRIHVVGIPRVDLALVSWRVNKSRTDPSVLNWNLPYEIIVVAVYKD